MDPGWPGRKGSDTFSVAIASQPRLSREGACPETDGKRKGRAVGSRHPNPLAPAKAGAYRPSSKAIPSIVPVSAVGAS